MPSTPTLPYSHCRSPRSCRALDLDAGSLGHELKRDCSSTPLLEISSFHHRQGTGQGLTLIVRHYAWRVHRLLQQSTMSQMRWRGRLYSSGNWTDDPPVVHLQSWFAGAPPPQFFRLLQGHNAFWWIRDGFDEALPLRRVN